MTGTLAALHRAVIAGPADRTVRLVYADALDETGEPAHRARARFIRDQVETETAGDDPHRLGELAFVCSKLFEANWLAWWAPVAEAARLPYPHEPGRRGRGARASGRGGRPADWPYTVTTGDTTVHLAEYGLSFRFAGGFPEEVRFRHFDAPEGGPALVHRWGDVIPLRSLAFESYVSTVDWGRVDGPHLARLPDLTFDRLLPETGRLVARSPHLTALTRLAATPTGSEPGTVRALVESPPWEGLRALRLAGRLSPDDVGELATTCTLRPEELEVGIGTPGLLGSPAVEAAGTILRAVIRAVLPLAEAAPRWAEYGPAFEALAAAGWVKGLRVLRITTGHAGGLLGLLGGRFPGGAEPAGDVVPDAAVLALAAAVRSDKLERLVLPAAVVGPSVREELTTWMGGTVAFT
jgi:uncharacterized protein (TIGR02996 family)